MIWHVGFVAADERWWQRLLRPGYAHCWAAREIDTGLWLWVEWTPSRVIFGLASAELVGKAAAHATEVLVWEAAEAAGPRAARPAFGLWHCATLAAHVMGLRLRPFATPWALACALRRQGARPLMLHSNGGPA